MPKVVQKKEKTMFDIIQNMPEFDALIKRYESITLREIERVWETTDNPAEQLTGFGNRKACSLCLAAQLRDHNGIKVSGIVCCEDCVWGYGTNRDMACLYADDNQITYDAIEYAETPQELLIAYRERAKHMRKRKEFLSQIERGQNNETGN